MARLFWVALGAAAGVYAVRKVSKAAEAYTPAGVAHGLSDFGDGLRELAAAVREGMAEREGELRLALGIDAGPWGRRGGRASLPTSSVGAPAHPRVAAPAHPR